MASLLGDAKDVLSLAFSILKLAGSWYSSADALDEFKRSVAKLEGTWESWQKMSRNYGLSSDNILRSSLKHAKEQLQREEARLKDLDRRCGCAYLCFRLSSGTDFPTQLGKSVVDLDKLISDSWKADDEAEAAAKRKAEALARSPKFGFRKDRRYVRIPVVEEELKTILNSEGIEDEAVRVVLLYGRAGSGKSSMARALALDYKQAASSHAEGCASSSANGCRQFDEVLYLEFGPGAQSVAKQVELFGMVDQERSFDSEKATYKDSNNVRAMLEQLLRERRSLIIFDDVWDGKILKDMVGVCGEQMRILVTSQKRYLCEDSLIEPTKSVPMDGITSEDSLRILKVHTGFRDDDDIPEAVQKCMRYLITKVCGHPHALASVGVAIDARHRNEVRQWEDAVREYDQLLDDSLSDHESTPLHDRQYEWSVTEAIQMKFKRLSKEERQLLVLMVMLGGPSVPQEVLQLFHGEIMTQNKSKGVGSSRGFSDARKRLENLQCIKTGDYQEGMKGVSYFSWEQCNEWRTGLGWMIESKRGLAWSIHSLDKQFVQRKMNNDVDDLLEVVKCLPDKIQGLKAEYQVNIAKLLGLLCFEYPFQIKIAKSWVNGTQIVQDWDNDLLSIIRLMAKKTGADWSLTSQQSCEQVFLSWITEGAIHIDAAKKLLNSSSSKHQMWNLMTCRVWRESQKWSIDQDIVVGVLRIFGDLRSFKDNSVILALNPEQWNALLVLVSRHGLTSARSGIFQMRDFVVELIKMLTSPCSENIKHFSTILLSYLVPLMHYKPSEYGEEGLASIPMILKGLVHTLQEYSDKEAHDRAAIALYTLAEHSYSDINQKIADIGFHQLLDNLEREENSSFDGRKFALAIIRHLVFDYKCQRGFDYEYPLINRVMILELSNCLVNIITKGLAPGYAKRSVVHLLMKIDIAKGKSIILRSPEELEERGSELIELGEYQNGINDLEMARRVSPFTIQHYGRPFACIVHARMQLKDWEGALKDFDYAASYIEQSYEWSDFFRKRSIVKRMMGDLPGALEDLDKSLQRHTDDYLARMQRGYVKFLMGDEGGARTDANAEACRLRWEEDDKRWCVFYLERGVLKRMMGDFLGALEDLHKSSDRSYNLPKYEKEGKSYSLLKQRGYVKFLMGNEEGARADAEEALQHRTYQFDKPGYENDRLLNSIVEFLKFRL